MITSFSDKITHDIYDGINSKKTRKIPLQLHDKARILMDQLNASNNIDDMRTPPDNNLEPLIDKLSDFWSVRINKQWHLIFMLDELKSSAYDVYIDDYHQ
ncbi:MAG: type II toxin-antitoxin system RelE/ParE family toxin [gamma proteobacterium symbiont of Taylorina sp.]|nr:type II toxin-antitoxin system RelE/ParE family toxin [gamma proteobacterium symbiont of Taylorina sp.]